MLEEQEWILDYLSSRKGTIPHEMMTRFDSLDIVPEKEFFSIEQFYSRLKGDIIPQQEYESVKKHYIKQ